MNESEAHKKILCIIYYYVAILIGHITGLSLCFIQVLNSKTKRHRKTKIVFLGMG